MTKGKLYTAYFYDENGVLWESMNVFVEDGEVPREVVKREVKGYSAKMWFTLSEGSEAWR